MPARNRTGVQFLDVVMRMTLGTLRAASVARNTEYRGATLPSKNLLHDAESLSVISLHKNMETHSLLT